MAELKETLDTLESQYKISSDELIKLISKTPLKPAQKIFIQESQSGDISKEEVEKMIDEESGQFKDVFQNIYKIESENPDFKGDKPGNYADTLSEDKKEKFKQYQELRKKLTKEDKEKLKSFSSLSNLLIREKKVLNTKLETTPNYDKVDALINGLKPEHKIKLLSNIFLNENKEYHPERNSLVHIKIVTARSMQYDDKILEKVALYHDMAKFDTVSFNPKGWPTSLGHDMAGAKLAEDPIVKYICANHMKIKSWVGKGEGSDAPLKPNTKLDVFNGTIDFPNPGQTDDEKAENFWRLVVFSKMDDMNNSFNPSSLKWDVSFENWDEKCPLKQDYKSSEFKVVDTKAEKAPMPFTSQEIIKFGALSPKFKREQIGQINKEISGKTKEEAFEIIKRVLENPELKMESKRWVKTFESFRKNLLSNRINENLTAQDKEMTLNIFSGVGVVVDLVDGVVTNFHGEIERDEMYIREDDFEEGLEPFKKAGVEVSYSPWVVQDGLDWDGSFSIDVPSLNDAIKNKRITIIVDPEDPEEYLEIKK